MSNGSTGYDKPYGGDGWDDYDRANQRLPIVPGKGRYMSRRHSAESRAEASKKWKEALPDMTTDIIVDKGGT